MPESPKYLMVRQKYEKARDSLLKIAWYNGVTDTEKLKTFRFEGQAIEILKKESQLTIDVKHLN